MAKNKRPKTTVNVNAVKKDIKKMAKQIAKSEPTQHTHAELAPGTVQRQSALEQDMGTAKYRQMIHDHNSKNKHILDRLPVTFPRKKKLRSNINTMLICPECNAYILGSEQTYMAICSSCKKLVKPHNPEAEARGYHSDKRVGMFNKFSPAPKKDD
jgi:hypothetical protein